MPSMDVTVMKLLSFTVACSLCTYKEVKDTVKLVKLWVMKKKPVSLSCFFHNSESSFFFFYPLEF